MIWWGVENWAKSFFFEESFWHMRWIRVELVGYEYYLLQYEIVPKCMSFVGHIAMIFSRKYGRVK